MFTHFLKEKIYEPACVIPEALSRVISTGDGLEKTSKFVVCVLDGAVNIAKHCAEMAESTGEIAFLTVAVVLKGKLKVVAEIISGLAFINRVFEWVCPEAGKSRPFWLNPPINFAQVKKTRSLRSINPAELLSWASKVVSRVFLTVGNFIDLMKLFDSIGLLTLGKVASTAIGSVPILGLVKDTVIVISSVFSIVSNAATLVNVVPKWNKARKKRNLWRTVAHALDAKKTVGPETEKEAAKSAARSQKRMERAERKLGARCAYKAEMYRRKRVAIFNKLERRSEKVIGGEELMTLINQDMSQDQKNQARDGFAPDKTCKKLYEKYLFLDQKAQKWSQHLAENDEGVPVLRGTVEEYATAKLGRAVHKAASRRDRAIQQAIAKQAKKTKAPAGDDSDTEAPAAPAPLRDTPAIAAARAYTSGLERLQAADNGASRFVRYRYEVCKVNETNTFRKTMKSSLAIAYDVAKIAIVILAVLSLALGLVTFGWSMAIFGLALAVNTIGLAKFFYDELVLKKVKKAPDIALA